MCAVVLEKLSIIAWIKEKRDFEMNPKHQYITMVVEILLLIPIPNEMLGETVSFQIKNISGEDVTFFVNDVLTAYLLLRSIYLVKFLIHAELYYGSRPDRLSRLYTVKFGTFNAVKFLINEKPLTVLLVIFIITFVFLPLLLMLVER